MLTKRFMKAAKTHADLWVRKRSLKACMQDSFERMPPVRALHSRTNCGTIEVGSLHKSYETLVAAFSWLILTKEITHFIYYCPTNANWGGTGSTVYDGIRANLKKIGFKKIGTFQNANYSGLRAQSEVWQLSLTEEQLHQLDSIQTDFTPNLNGD